MTLKRELLVLGVSVVRRNFERARVTKVPTAEYLNELAHCFGECIWVVQQHKGAPLAGVIGHHVRIVRVRYSPVFRPIDWLRLVFECRSRPYVLLHLPMAASFLPVLPLLRLLARHMVTYLGGDYLFWLRHSRLSRWLGGEWLYRTGHEYPMRIADAVIARGRYLAGLAHRFNELVFETVPLGHMDWVEASKPRRNGGDTRRILYLGKVLWSKGLKAAFLRLFPALAYRIWTYHGCLIAQFPQTGGEE